MDVAIVGDSERGRGSHRHAREQRTQAGQGDRAQSFHAFPGGAFVGRGGIIDGGNHRSLSA